MQIRAKNSLRIARIVIIKNSTDGRGTFSPVGAVFADISARRVISAFRRAPRAARAGGSEPRISAIFYPKARLSAPV